MNKWAIILVLRSPAGVLSICSKQWRRGVKKILNSKFKNAGFTMLELIVVFVIIGILATIGVPNYKKFQSNQALKESVQQIETELGKAFSSARSHPEHFGLKVENSKIILFKIIPKENPDEDEDEIEESSFILGKGIKIEEDFKIIFERPYGDIDLDNSDSSLELKSPTGKRVTININQKSGLITHKTHEE